MFIRLIEEMVNSEISGEEGSVGRGGKGGREGSNKREIDNQILGMSWTNSGKKNTEHTRHRWKRKLYLIEV